jgi:DNA-binding beta-propeller fold protein YncE
MAICLTVFLVIVLVASPKVIAAGGETNLTFGRSWPLSVAIDSRRGVAYVDAESGDYPPTGFTFGIINSASGTVEKTLGFPAVPGRIAIDEATGTVYVGSGESINVFDPKTNSFGIPLKVGQPIFDLTFDNISGDLLLTSGNMVYKLDPSTGSITASAKAGASAEGLAIDWVRGEIYVADYLSASVSVLRESDLAPVATIALPSPSYPSELAIDRARGEVYVTTDENSILVLGLATKNVLRTIPLGAGGITASSAISLDERDGLAFVSSNPGSSIVEVDESNGEIVSKFAVNSTVYEMAFDQATGRLFATNYHQVTIITPASPSAHSPLTVAVVVGVAICIAAVAVVYSRVVTASGGRRDGSPSQPQTAPSWSLSSHR